MSTHERLLTVAQRLDELAAELGNDELTALSNELAEIADIGGADKPLFDRPQMQEPPRTELEKRINELINHEVKRRMMESLYGGGGQHFDMEYFRREAHMHARMKDQIQWADTVTGRIKATSPNLKTLANGDTLSFTGPEVKVTEA